MGIYFQKEDHVNLKNILSNIKGRFILSIMIVIIFEIYIKIFI